MGRSTLRPRRACVYTCLFGGYEELTEQPISSRSGVDFICFTDDQTLTSTSWQVRVVPPAVPGDPQRSSRYPKICAHRFLERYKLSLYIDNSVLLRRPPEDIFEHFLSPGRSMAGFEHDHRETVEDEFRAVAKLGYESEEISARQLERYRASHPDVLGMKPIIGGVLIRRHMKREVIGAMDLWWAEVVEHSRRDQLSLLVALKESGLDPEIAGIAIRDNVFWAWPKSQGRIPRPAEVPA